MEIRMRTITWNDKQKCLQVIDQTALPAEFRVLDLRSSKDVEQAIFSMVIRGAPAIGIAAAFGLAIAALEITTSDPGEFKQELTKAGNRLIRVRPTANSISVAINYLESQIDHFTGSPDEIRELLIKSAQAMAEQDVQINQAIAEHGAGLINDGDHIVHHCNTGSLAAVDYGTALGCIRRAHEQGKHIHVYVDESRPLLQGARLTAWELGQYGIPYDIIVDSSAGLLIRSGLVQKVMFGADRVAANGDVVNKVGSYMLSLAALDNGIPAFSVFPTSAIDYNYSNGDAIKIEQRDPSEVLDIQFHGTRATPLNATALNYAFDITPHRLLSGLVTEKGVFYPPFSRELTLQRHAKGSS